MKAGATNEKGRGAGIFHLIVRILTLPPIVIGITVLLMYVPANLLTLRELLLCELFLLLIPMAAYPIRESAARHWYAVPSDTYAGFSGQC